MNAPIPMDPYDVEQLPPEDLDLCDHCGGSGGVWPTPDPQDVVDCPRCGGSGYLPDLGAAS